jgi:N-acetylglucosamine-6-phosphate deacetylase
MIALSPARLFTGDRIIERATVRVSSGRVVDVSSAGGADAIELDGLLAPGFVDVQVNGGGGALFNDAPTVETLTTIAAAHRRFGVTSLMATLISDQRSKMREALAAVAAAVESGLDGIIGLHLEGPWLAEPRRGVHQSQHLRDFDSEDLQLLREPRNFPLLVTLAPERIDRESLRGLAEAGVVVSLGHTAASAEDVAAALAAGARGVTHLFNAMPALEARRPGPVGAALETEACWTGLILDGVHVHPMTARLAFSCKGAAKLMLVSDSMATVGSAQSAMTLLGQQITLSGGALRTDEGTLAGAHLDLSAAVRNAVHLLGAPRDQALRMASLTPAEFLGVDQERGRVAPGCRADFVLLSENLEVEATWIGGTRLDN